MNQLASNSAASSSNPSIFNAPKTRFGVDASAVDNQNKAQVRIEEMISRGASRAGDVIGRVMSEVPVDRIAKASAFEFRADEESANRNVYLALSGVEEGHDDSILHDHALGQAGDLADMRWVRDLAKRTHTPSKGASSGVVDGWGARLAAQSLNEAFSRLDSRHLVRSVEGKVRGIVSDKFRRMDARPILDAALKAFEQVGLRPYEGRWLETKLEIQAIIPQLYSPVPGELLAFGLSLRTSDYGDGAFDIRAFMLRPACANGMIADSVLRAVHIGKRITENFELSQRTHDLDTKAMASVTSDVVRGAFAAGAIETRLLGIKSAFEREVDPKKAQEALRRALSKGEVESVVAHFNSPDVVTLPPGQNALRMSNAISWLANETKDERRQIELQEVAGQWIAPSK